MNKRCDIVRLAVVYTVLLEYCLYKTHGYSTSTTRPNGYNYINGGNNVQSKPTLSTNSYKVDLTTPKTKYQQHYQNPGFSIPSRIAVLIRQDASFNVTAVGITVIINKRKSDVFFYEKGVDRPPKQSTVRLHNWFINTNEYAKPIGQSGLAMTEMSKAIMKRYKINMGAPPILPYQAAVGRDMVIDAVDCPFRHQQCDPRYPYRSADGSCNNLKHPEWGMAETPFKRFLRPIYDDGVNSPRTRSDTGNVLPSARRVSTDMFTEDSILEIRGLTHLVMQWGQFVDHDITSTPIETGLDRAPIRCCIQDMLNTVDINSLPVLNRLGFIDRAECFPIEIPINDRHFNRTCMNFVRSLPASNKECSFGPRQQLNQISSYLDGSMVYGSSDKHMTSLRTGRGGLMIVQGFNMLPKNEDENCVITGKGEYCYKAGDDRVNENPGLASMHTVWIREHNRAAGILSSVNPHWDDEKIFQETRKVVIAMIQHITYREWLPLVLGNELMTKYELITTSSGFSGSYEENIDATIRNVFATAAFRFGHSLVRPHLTQVTRGYPPSGNLVTELKRMYGRTEYAFQNRGEGVDMLIRGLASDKPQACDRFITRQMTDHLFEDSQGNSLDLAALNIQRGRDHGLPSYNDWREFCGLPRLESFCLVDDNGPTNHSVDAAKRLKELYLHPDDIDLFAGGVSEIPVEGGLVGPTFACIIARQFGILKKGDVFWYENGYKEIGLTFDQLSEIKRITLGNVLCSNSQIGTIQGNAFIQAWQQNPRIQCSQLDDLDFTKWRDFTTLNSLSTTAPVVTHATSSSPLSGWTPWSSWSACSDGKRWRQRFCIGQITSCTGFAFEYGRCQSLSVQVCRFINGQLTCA